MHREHLTSSKRSSQCPTIRFRAALGTQRGEEGFAMVLLLEKNCIISGASRGEYRRLAD